MKNGVVSISKFLSTVPKDALLCAEHTGVYGDLLVYLCNQVEIPIALVPGYTIKHSLGLLKGKTDPIDARRIREYGEHFTDKLVFSEYDEECIVEINYPEAEPSRYYAVHGSKSSCQAQQGI